MTLRTLGELRLETAAFKRAKTLLLVAYLALEGARDRRHIAELFWPDAADHMKSLTVSLAQARKAVPSILEADATRVWTNLQVDAAAFLHHADTSDEAALALYKGPFLDGLHLKNWGVELEEWVYTTREFLAAKARYALLRLGEEAAATGRFELAAERAASAYRLRAAPYPEPGDLVRLHTLLLAGESPAALQVKEEAEGFDLDFLETSEAARAGLLATSPERPRLSGGATKLPLRATSFVGRDLELTEMANLLDGGHRLITLLGPGGVGKTRLALQLAHERQRLGGEVRFVPLDALGTPEGVIPEVAEAFGLEVSNAARALEDLQNVIAADSVLLVLDNFEHLIEAALSLPPLLQHCPNLKLLVTSRERLNLEEEYAFQVNGLVFPKDAPLEEAVRFDAANLFVQRAKRARPTFQLDEDELDAVLRICELVEGLPLGLELAAAVVKLMPVDEIADELSQGVDVLATPTRNVPERQRSLQATFEYSWQLLSPKEQILFAKLSVFRGGFKREAVTRIADATIPLLGALVDKSLLRVDEGGRYSLHPLLAQYAAEKLAEAPSALEATEDAHARYYFSFLLPREHDLDEEAFKRVLKAIDEDWENVRAVFRWSLENLDEEVLRRCVDALEVCFERRGYLSEGLAYLGELEARLPEKATSYDSLLGRVKVEQAWYHVRLEGYADAARLAREALPILEAHNDHWASKGHNALGAVAFTAGDFEEARSHMARALAVARAHGDLYSCIALQGNLAMTYQQLGDLKRAEKEIAAALKLSRDLGRVHRVIFCLNALGDLEREFGALDKAEAHLKEALALARELQDRLFQTISLLTLSRVAYDRASFLEAKAFAQEALELNKDMRRPEFEKSVVKQLAAAEVALGYADKVVALEEEGG